MRTVLPGIALALLLAGCATPTQMSLDAEVKRLCAIDGGIKIYQTVTLTADRFNRFGQINFYRATQGENALGPEYRLQEEHHYYRKGDPQLVRHHYRIVRRLDGGLLGETIVYGRGGGDVPGPWHGSSFTCPTYAEAGVVALLQKVFLSSDRESQR